jgi:cell wall-associated NlpC family hydrolase
MQFEPGTWARYAVSADPAKPGAAPDPYDPWDAIYAAANDLHANGAPGDWPRAIYAYNHAGWYVSEVLALGRQLRHRGRPGRPAASSALCEQARPRPAAPGTAGKVIRYVEAQLGKRYVFGGTGSDAFDCSGLAMMAYRAAGIAIHAPPQPSGPSAARSRPAR